ncbi:hypothetical protein RvY_04830 [Ramazzottius varieornatus]|uniref:Uncharacterized protein n=1 Tax=Ramazzottius varieornatus TaxID=947166 RepID=A0A1D1UYK9_RAMVA|nr:hypothetical protein RvY_04830 [Ramazzottius varieornatus]
MDSDTTARRPKSTREEQTYKRLLAVDDINLYQYPPGKEFDRNVKEFKEKHPKHPRESGDEEDPANIVDRVIQSLAVKKDNQPPAVPKGDQRSPSAVNKDGSLFRGMSKGNKATAPLYSVGDKDSSDGAEEHAQDVRANLETSKAAKNTAIATAYREALAKDGTAEEQQFPEVNDAGSSTLPSRTFETSFEDRAADLLQTYNSAASQIEAMRDLDKIERQIDMEERKNDRKWQKEKFAKVQELKEKRLEIEKEIRLTEVKERTEDRQILFQTIRLFRDVLINYAKK